MSTSQKVALGILILIGLCFVAAMILPGGSGSGTPGETEQAAGPFRLLRPEPPSVDRSQLTSGCLEGDQLIFTGTCTLTVAAGDAATLRTVRLRSAQPLAVDAPAPRTEELRIEADLDPGQELLIAVDESGAEIELGCGALGGCVVRVS
jgi:hypothetical protein